ncbi:MAG TPA: hypothetical protein VF173_33710 [Thermoanaerobaculia bacterium]|nr:hypothetical protein [Thermoanaerobaculia bacterium]
MRTQAVFALARTRSAGAFLLSLLVGGALLGDPAPVGAQGRVTFTQLSIEQCKGTCTLKLSCGVGGKPAAELVSGQGRTKDLIDIGKSLEVPQFPAEVKCSASKDTGWIGTTWTPLGTGSVTLPQGGDFKLDINGAEGSLRVMLAVDSLELLLPAGPPPAAAAAPKGKKGAAGKAAAPLQVAATFNPAKEGHAVVIGLEWPAFKDKVDKMGTQGMKLVAIKVFDDAGKRRWAGIFKNIPDRVVLRANQEWKDFRADWTRMTGGLARLVDVEVYDTKPLYSGLYRDFSERKRPMMWTDERKNFVDKVKELAAEGQQLIDLEVYTGPTKTTYIGTFRNAPGKYELWTGSDKAAFEAKWKDASGKGLQMVEIVPYKEGGKRVYDSITRSGVGPAGDVLVDADVATFVKRWLEDTGKGLRLTNLSLYHD